MKKYVSLFCLICLLTVLKTHAQNYLINFTGTGSSNIVSTVKVENLTKNTTLTLSGGDILRLTGVTGVNSPENNQSSELKIYPNPMNDNSIMEISPPVKGNGIITVIDIMGKTVAQIQSYLDNFRQDFRLSGIKSGFYLINVRGDNYQFSGKLLSNGKSGGTIKIEKVNSIINAVEEKVKNPDSKGTQGTVDMAYSTGDRLKFTGISGNYSTIKTDIPTSDKTLTFNFIPCTDGDNNNYPIVEIGSQVWMGENLKTTKYNDGTNIPLVTDITTWSNLSTPGFCWFNNNQANYMAIYGALYNWYSVKTEKLCPIGWHVPDDAEWTMLSNYLGGENIAGGKLKETGFIHWLNPNTGATNESGFTALPGGNRTDYAAFNDIGNFGYWWSATEYNNTYAWLRYLFYDNRTFKRVSYDNKSGFSVRCLKDETSINLPIITTVSVTSLTSTTANSGGNIISDGGAAIIAKGVCWSTSQNPTVNDSITMEGTGSENFLSTLTGLMTNTRYFVRSYAINSAGIGYGNEVSFNLWMGISTDWYRDRQGNLYWIVRIGDQLWLGDNIRSTVFQIDGEDIPLVTDADEWKNLTTPAYCWFNNNDAQKGRGALYNWYAVNTGKLCPSGWHVSTDSDWKKLEMFLGMSQTEADAELWRGTTQSSLLKSASAWSNSGNTNISGFSAKPGYFRYGSGVFADYAGSIYEYASWWTSSESSSEYAINRALDYNSPGVYRNTSQGKNGGHSVRCVVD